MKHSYISIISSSVTISLILLTPFYSIVHSTTIVPETCKHLSQIDSRIYYDFCEAALGTAPGSDQSTNITQLGSVSFQLDISQIEPILSKIDTLLQDPKSDLLTNDALMVCKELYSGARDDLVVGLKYFEDAEYLMANLRASETVNGTISCESGLREKRKGTVSVLSTENSDFLQLVAISLGFTKLLAE